MEENNKDKGKFRKVKKKLRKLENQRWILRLKELGFQKGGIEFEEIQFLFGIKYTTKPLSINFLN